MKDKQELIAEIQQGLATGIITEDDVKGLVHAPEPNSVIMQPQESANSDKPEKLSAVDVMFYVAGIVLFSAIMSIIVQSWSDGNAIIHILLSAGVGAGLWCTAFYLINSSIQSDVRKGLINSLLLTGSLSIIVGGYIITNELIGGFNEVNFVPAAIWLAVIGGVHIAFDRLVKRDLTLLLGILLCVISFPVLLFGFLKDTEVPVDMYTIIVIVTSGLLAYATRVVAKIDPARKKIHNAFDSFAAFVALGSMYISSFTDYGSLWFLALIASVFGFFYLSIILQSKRLLGNASFFLVLTVITISFKYFSGYGVTASLILATLGLLGTAAMASSINKKYFNNSVSS